MLLFIYSVSNTGISLISYLSPLTSFFFPNAGLIFRNAVTRNVTAQHAMTMMKNAR